MIIRNDKGAPEAIAFTGLDLAAFEARARVRAERAAARKVAIAANKAKARPGPKVSTQMVLVGAGVEPEEWQRLARGEGE